MAQWKLTTHEITLLSEGSGAFVNKQKIPSYGCVTDNARDYRTLFAVMCGTLRQTVVARVISSST